MQLSKNGFNQKLYAFSQIGGGERDRTDDPLRARQVLSQLSYAPNIQVRLIDNWWAKEDSNLRPHDYQSCALAS